MAKKNPYDDTQLAGTLSTDTTQGEQPAQPAPAYSPPATPPGGGADAGTTAQAPAQKSSPNRFQNLQRMLYANQGQGAGVAQKVQSTAQNLADVAQSQLGQVQANYRAQAAQGQGQAPQAPQSPYADQGGTAAAPLGRDGRPAGMNALVARNPQVIGIRGLDLRHGGGVGMVDAPAVSDAQLAQYYNQLQGLSYTGPDSLAQANGYGDAVQAADRAAQAGQALQSPGGIQALLGEGGGGGALDSLLAQEADGRGLQAAGQRFAGLRQQLATAGKDTGFSTQAKNQVAALNQQGLAGNAELVVKAQAKADAQARQDQANQQMADDETAYKAYQAAVKKGVGGGPFGPQWTPGAPTLQDWIAAGRPAGPQKQAHDPGQWG